MTEVRAVTVLWPPSFKIRGTKQGSKLGWPQALKMWPWLGGRTAACIAPPPPSWTSPAAEGAQGDAVRWQATSRWRLPGWSHLQPLTCAVPFGARVASALVHAAVELARAGAAQASASRLARLALGLVEGGLRVLFGGPPRIPLVLPASGHIFCGTAPGTTFARSLCSRLGLSCSPRCLRALPCCSSGLPPPCPLAHPPPPHHPASEPDRRALFFSSWEAAGRMLGTKPWSRTSPPRARGRQQGSPGRSRWWSWRSLEPCARSPPPLLWCLWLGHVGKARPGLVGRCVGPGQAAPWASCWASGWAGGGPPGPDSQAWGARGVGL